MTAQRVRTDKHTDKQGRINIVTLNYLIFTACETGRWGEGCEGVCTCESGVSCDIATGECGCSTGKCGGRCEQTCDCPNGCVQETVNFVFVLNTDICACGTRRLN
jgi:hypothetical protein